MQLVRSFVDNKIIVIVSRIVVGGLFTLAGIVKLLRPIEDFIEMAHSWNVIPDPWLSFYAVPLPWLELFFGLALLLGLFRKFSAVVIGLMLISFIIGILLNIWRGDELSGCGCFGGILSLGETFEELLWRDIGLLILTVITGITSQTWLTVDGWLGRE